MKTDDYLQLTPYEKEVVDRLEKCQSSLSTIAIIVVISFILLLVGVIVAIDF